MNVKNIFNSDFVAHVVNTLDEKCINGETLTREELCQALDLASPLPEKPSDPEAPKGESDSPAWSAYKSARARNLTVEAIVGSLITLDVIQGFDTRKGPGGGIGKVGEKRQAAAKDAKKNTRKEFPEGFLDNLTTALNTLCVEPGKCVPRRDIAKSMGTPGSETDALISAALASGRVPGFGSQRGVGGGIKRLAAGEVAAPEPTVQAEETVTESSETTEELQAAPQSHDTMIPTGEDATEEVTLELAPEETVREEETATAEEPAAPKKSKGKKSKKN